MWTKTKGSEEPYINVRLSDFYPTGDIPPFDDSIKWRKKTDRRPQATRNGSPLRGKPRSASQAQDRLNPRTHQMSRENSLNDAPKKKSRQEVQNIEMEFVNCNKND